LAAPLHPEAPPTPVAAPPHPEALPVEASLGASPSTLAAQNDLFGRAHAAARASARERAVELFGELLSRYPRGPLAESAAVERMRLLRGLDPDRAGAAARSYLYAYPLGFARAEAEALVRGDAAPGTP
jgi:hypothetical protein